jgi:hypothetical protein
MVGIRSVLIIVVSVAFMTSGCDKLPQDEQQAVSYEETKESGLNRAEIDLTTDTRSNVFVEQEEKMAFLEQYLIMPSEVIDAEYHVIYWDNSGGIVPGPSDWDIRAAFRVAEGDIPLWTADMERILPEQLELQLWDDLKSDALSWEDGTFFEYYKRPGNRSYVAVNREQGIVLKFVSTTFIPPVLDESLTSGEAAGYEDEKVLVADKDVKTTGGPL